MDDLTQFCCHNPTCAKVGLRGQGNIAQRGFYGKQRRRLLYCKTCGQRFSERKGTPLFHCQLEDSKAFSVLEHLAEGCGIRQTERLVHVHRDTVMRLSRKAGQHAQQAHDELVSFSPQDHQTATGRKVVLRRQKRKAR